MRRWGPSWVREYGRRPVRWSMGTALLLSLLVLALATRFKFLEPTYYGLGLAAQLVETQAGEEQLAGQREELGEVLGYLRSPGGEELAARSELSALKPGERVIEVEKEGAPAGAPPQDLGARVQQALEAAGEAAVDRLKQGIRVVKTWSGLEPLPGEEREPREGEVRAEP